MQYWKQVYKINFPKLNVTFENNLHIGFQIDKDTTKESNKAKLEIYNLSDATRKKIEVPDTEVEIYAGSDASVRSSLSPWLPVRMATQSG